MYGGNKENDQFQAYITARYWKWKPAIWLRQYCTAHKGLQADCHLVFSASVEILFKGRMLSSCMVCGSTLKNMGKKLSFYQFPHIYV